MRRPAVCGRSYIVLLAILAVLPKAAVAVDISKWSTYDFTFDSGSAYSNGYSSGPATFNATFTGPGGITKTVPGFWDGGDVFKVRFTPTVEGNWSYTTSSSDADLQKTESFTVSALNAGNHGFLRIDASNPQHFVYDDVRRHFMWGQTYYSLMHDAMQNDNWKTAVDNSLSYGMNKVRMFVYSQGGFVNYSNVSHGYPDVTPYAGAADSPDRDGLNFTYLHKLDEVVQYMQSKGMGADLILTNFYSNGKMAGTDTQNDRFVQYITARYAAYDNVTWCLANEWNLGNTGTYPQNQADFNRIGSLVRTSDPWMDQDGAFRPLSIHHSGNDVNFDFSAWSSWATHAILQFRGNSDVRGNAGIVAHLGHNMPVVNDEYYYIGAQTQTETRQTIWGIAAAGGYGSEGDARTFGSGATQWMPCRTGEWADAPGEYGDIKRMADFFTTKGIEYWKMASHNELKSGNSRAYLLAEPGRQYVAYAAVGGSFSLTLAPGTYHAYLYNPRTGVESPWSTPTIVRTTTGTQSFTMPPGTDDWVIRLTTTPEPGTLVLLGMGLAAMAVYRWRGGFRRVC